MFAVLDPQARLALITGLAVGVSAGWWAGFQAWWIVMHKAWVNAHELRRKHRMRALKPGRRDWRGVWR